MRAFEDFVVGETIDYGQHTVNADEIVAFAETYDPQPIHRDPDAVETAEAGGLVASGWHVAVTFMRLMADAMLLEFDQHGLARHRDTGLDQAGAPRRHHPRPLDRARQARLGEPAGDGTGALPPRGARRRRRDGDGDGEFHHVRKAHGSGIVSAALAMLAVGERHDFGAYEFTAERIKDFARRYDPQPFHMDEEAAKASAFGGLIASGWHTTLMAVRLQADYFAARAARGEAVPRFGRSPGIEMLRWMKPVYAGDRIVYSGTVSAMRPSSERPGWGLVTIDYVGVNQTGAPVFVMTGHLHVAV